MCFRSQIHCKTQSTTLFITDPFEMDSHLIFNMPLSKLYSNACISSRAPHSHFFNARLPLTF